MSPERQLDVNAVVIGKGAAVPAKTILRGAASTVLTQTVVNEEPAFTKVNLATMVTGALDLTTSVTGVLPAANGGTGLNTSASTGVAQVTAGTWSVSPIDLATADVSGVLPAANGGTGLNTSGSTGVAQVTAGTWSVSAIDLATADVTGVLPVANGGAGLGFAALTYGPTISAPNTAAGNWFVVVVNDAAAHAFSAPINGIPGRIITLTVFNGTGGAIATATFAGAYRIAPYVPPAAGKYTSGCFQTYDGTNWFQIAPWTTI